MSCPYGDSFIAYVSGGFDTERHVEKFSMNFYGNQDAGRSVDPASLRDAIAWQ
jgi:hypothetical protein